MFLAKICSFVLPIEPFWCKMTSSRILRLCSVLLIAAGLSACATAPTDPAERAEYDRLNDPLEPTNRAIFEFNQVVDKILLKPLAEAYRYVMPDFAQNVVGNVLNNAGEPVRMANALLQGRVTDAHNIMNRFIANTVGGLGGIADVAAEGGLGPINADFGQTLHVWGMPEGPYLVLPILGPSNPRDAIGFAGDSLAQPWGYAIEELRGVGDRNRYTIASVSATALDKRSRALDALESLEKGSLDFYAQLRSVSRQYRNKQLGVSEKLDHSEFEDVEETKPAPKPKKRSARKAPKAASVNPQQATPIAATQPVPPPAPSLAMEPVMPLAPVPPPAIVPVSAPAAAPVPAPHATEAMKPAEKPETAAAPATTDANAPAPAFGVPDAAAVPAAAPAPATGAAVPPAAPVPAQPATGGSH